MITKAGRFTQSFFNKFFLKVLCSVLVFHIIHDIVIFSVGRFVNIPFWAGVLVVVVLSIVISKWIERSHEHI
jgi:hypothetical protein